MESPLAKIKQLALAHLGFSIHLLAYVLVNALLISINLATSTAHLWFLWPMAGWGVGLVLHLVLAAYLPEKPERKQRRIARELRQRALTRD